MVNEINKPPSENAALGERLMASNRQLREMQEEHRRLMQEMELLRQRATDLGRLTAQQEQMQQQEQQPTATEISTVTASASEVASTTEMASILSTTRSVEETAHTAEHITSTAPTSSPTTLSTSVAADSDAATAPEAKLHITDHAECAAPVEEEDAETAAYLSEKLSEIARLKAQYKRVQNLINTTNLIEAHVGEENSNDAPSEAVPTQNQPTAAAPISSNSEETTSLSAASSPTAHNENEVLISTMMNMFTDFTSDLRIQAEGLRAERERIRALKEELLSRRRPT